MPRLAEFRFLPNVLQIRYEIEPYGPLGLNVAITGTDGPDLLLGTIISDNIVGAAGNDVIIGAGGLLDYLEGGEGDDLIVAGVGANLLAGGVGGTIVEGGAGDDRVFGSIMRDRVNGNEGDDRLVGRMGDDQLEGDAGNDTVSGGAGDDILSGGSAVDPGATDVLDGGLGEDEFQLEYGSLAIILDFQSGEDELWLDNRFEHEDLVLLGEAASFDGGDPRGQVRYEHDTDAEYGDVTLVYVRDDAAEPSELQAMLLGHLTLSTEDIVNIW